MKARFFMAALAVVLSMGVAVAQNGNGKGKNQVQKPEGKHPGVCLYQSCPNFVDQNNDGVCDNCAGKGIYFVDKNNNGICDNFENGTPQGKNCT